MLAVVNALINFKIVNQNGDEMISYGYWFWNTTVLNKTKVIKLWSASGSIWFIWKLFSLTGKAINYEIEEFHFLETWGFS